MLVRPAMRGTLVVRFAGAGALAALASLLFAPASSARATVEWQSPNEGAVLKGTVGIKVVGSADGFLERVEEIKLAAAGEGAQGGSWAGQCPKDKDCSTFSLEATWDTRRGSSGLLPNGTYVLTAVVRTSSPFGGDEGKSEETVFVSNPPARPVWKGEGVVSSPEGAGPRVTLTWEAGKEPDLREYWIYRQAPWEEAPQPLAVVPGSRTTYEDRDFVAPSPRPEGYAGSYRYFIVALRPRPSSDRSTSAKCRLDVKGNPDPVGDPCIASEASEVRGVTLSPPQPPSPGSSPAGAAPVTEGAPPPPQAAAPSLPRATLPKPPPVQDAPFSLTLPYPTPANLEVAEPGEESPGPLGWAARVVRRRELDKRAVLVPVAGGMMLMVSAGLALKARQGLR